mmetsp:Transcript_1205/g.2207  ORF Transcript_1205/g.2207 Transcript_1205/m.2207 type:complete len:89 (+) Transcript_1205:491-757(+)|eukprot:CAMPEP_0168617076 /NCGR_PEP_ID=MMETSP0449_2-20121227/5358_1 /TAXON_ID=1082188 /ORGANISM="Strombidium rassoulzadegani, Strain ras09" /LENGTH=88 /DNA_ID=CAMNT_0008657885 /DNA_START=468 /DNA_END=734 /DNA_ORIENTATION=+
MKSHGCKAQCVDQCLSDVFAVNLPQCSQVCECPEHIKYDPKPYTNFASAEYYLNRPKNLDLISLAETEVTAETSPKTEEPSAPEKETE